ncbi:hypothetical protein Tco_0405709 [Tanacetum coccineum]
MIDLCMRIQNENETEKEKGTIDDLGKGKAKGGSEPKDGGEEFPAEVDNEPEVEKVIEEDNAAAVSLEVEDHNEENMKDKESDKVKVSDKEWNEKEGNENEGNDNVNKNEVNNDALHKEQQVKTEKDKQAKIEKVEQMQRNNDQGYYHLT